MYPFVVERRRNINCIWSSNLPQPGFFASDSLVLLVRICSIVVPSLCKLVVVCCSDCTITASNWVVGLPCDIDGAVFDAPLIGCAGVMVFTVSSLSYSNTHALFVADAHVAFRDCV